MASIYESFSIQKVPTKGPFTLNEQVAYIESIQHFCSLCLFACMYACICMYVCMYILQSSLSTFKYDLYDRLYDLLLESYNGHISLLAVK